MWVVIAFGEDNNAAGSGQEVSLEAREIIYMCIYISKQHKKKDISFSRPAAIRLLYSVPINLSSKDFYYTIYKVSYNLKINDLSDKRSGSVEILKGICMLRDWMLHRMYNIFSCMSNATRLRR